MVSREKGATGNCDAYMGLNSQMVSPTALRYFAAVVAGAVCGAVEREERDEG